MAAPKIQSFVSGNLGSIVTVLIFLLTISFSTGGLWMKVSYMQKDIDEINTHLRRIKLISTVELHEESSLWSINAENDNNIKTEEEEDRPSQWQDYHHGG